LRKYRSLLDFKHGLSTHFGFADRKLSWLWKADFVQREQRSGILCERLFPRTPETSELSIFRRRLHVQNAEKFCAALQKEMQRGAIT